MLSAIIDSGFTITGTLPLRTELERRMVGKDANALASSIVLVCRKRPDNAPQASRRQFLDELKSSLPQALQDLQTGNIAPVDLAQAAIGPGMALFSRYGAVLESDGTPMTVRQALQAINAELDSYLASQDGFLDSASRFCIALYTQCAFNNLKFGEADVLARAKNISVDKLAELGVLTSTKGIVALKSREDLPAKPPKMEALASCNWLLTQYLVKNLDTGGIMACARLGSLYPQQIDSARELAYRLFALAERKGWTKEAGAYNNLVISWPEITRQLRDFQTAHIRPELS